VVATVTLVNVSDEGDILRTGCVTTATPEPVAATVSLPAALATVMSASLASEVAGLNANVKVWDTPALMVKGVTGAVKTKSSGIAVSEGK
jgi:hypothetical protein